MIDNGLNKKHAWTADSLFILYADRSDKGHYHRKNKVGR
jgi:hypothetical protein